MKCRICKRARCKWVDIDPKKAATEKIEQIIHHNISYIDMVCNGVQSSGPEERMYGWLAPYEEELEKRRGSNETL